MMALAGLLTGRWKMALAGAAALALVAGVGGWTLHMRGLAANAEARAAKLETQRAATAELLSRCDAARSADAAALSALRIEIDVRDERVRQAEARNAAFQAGRAARARQSTTAAARAAETARGGNDAQTQSPAAVAERRAQLLRDIAAIDAASAATSPGGGQRP